MVDSGANRSLVYIGATRGREKNTIHVVTGPPDPAQPTRAERDAYAAAQIRRRAALRKAGRPDLAREVPLRMPDRPSDLQLAPWEAVLAQALQQDEPERTALEEIQAAQDFTTHAGHIFQLRQAFWQLDVVPKIDEMVRQRIPAAEYERYLKDPERPAFLQLLREHEIGGRRIEDVLDSITAEPLDGLRSIAAGLHGRAGKEPPPARGETKTWAERTPAQAPRRDPGSGPDGGPAASRTRPRSSPAGRRSGPPGMGRSAGGAGARCGRTGSSGPASSATTGRSAGITDPAQAIGPVPSGQPDLAEMFHASVRALQLPDEAALLKAMGQGELEAAVDEHDRAAALAPADVQAEIDQREAELEDAQVRAHIAGGARDAEAQAAGRGRGRGRRGGPGPARRRRRGPAGVGRGARRASGPGRGSRARAPLPRPGRAHPGDGRRGGRGLGGGRGRRRPWTRPSGLSSRPSRPPTRGGPGGRGREVGRPDSRDRRGADGPGRSGRGGARRAEADAAEREPELARGLMAADSRSPSSGRDRRPRRSEPGAAGARTRRTSPRSGPSSSASASWSTGYRTGRQSGAPR